MPCVFRGNSARMHRAFAIWLCSAPGDSWRAARQYMQRRRALSGGRFLVRLCGGLRLIHGYLLYGLLPVLFARSLATWSLAGARASARSRLLLSRCSVPRPEGCAAAVERDHGGRRGAATRRGSSVSRPRCLRARGACDGWRARSICVAARARSIWRMPRHIYTIRRTSCTSIFS